MTATANMVNFPMFTPIKQNDADWFHCQFCALTFPTYDEYKYHTYRHFNTRACPVCHVLLIQICGDEWFCLHTTSHCQHSDNDALPMVIKQEMQPEIDSNLSTEIETDEKYGFQTVFLHHSNTDYREPREERLFSDMHGEELMQRNYLVEVLFDGKAAFAKEKANKLRVQRRKKAPSHAHRPKTFTCEICEKTLSSYYCIKGHMESKHSPKRKAKLSTCNKTAKGHMCSVCGKRFTDRSNMRAHERTHSLIKSTCEVCGKKLSDKKGLVKHMKVVHQKERRHHCNIDGCEWTFGHSGALKVHQARKHGLVTKPNACPICSKEFPNSTYHLNRHLKAHANNTAKVHIPKEPKVEPKVEPKKPAEASEVLK